ncbi:DUF192 family protein [Natrialba magadii ATCC 43099]|uniref:DUF192 family protein n=1 Tax=Natrialba magadii (strain ATCC 43099 / DSM 3394 / CCM 3739 / CIP 104546 / IAM 13178 / JCM 8861 / NBRC 102185 / NCIMB 2190 / MS3) TaxID=547559 RepID=D3STK7_NATMM|nr:DUF192 family protein [Natrialba magadii ATCC 43099]
MTERCASGAGPENEANYWVIRHSLAIERFDGEHVTARPLCVVLTHSAARLPLLGFGPERHTFIQNLSGERTEVTSAAPVTPTVCLQSGLDGIDTIYADDEGTITGIHHAPEPGPDEDGADHEYPGRGLYVLEVVYGWTDEHDVSEGDVLAFDLEETVPAS